MSRSLTSQVAVESRPLGVGSQSINKEAREHNFLAIRDPAVWDALYQTMSWLFVVSRYCCKKEFRDQAEKQAAGNNVMMKILEHTRAAHSRLGEVPFSTRFHWPWLVLQLTSLYHFCSAFVCKMIANPTPPTPPLYLRLRQAQLPRLELDSGDILEFEAMYVAVSHL